jgi:hypothetical protein
MIKPADIDDITWEVLTAANSGDVVAMRRLLAEDPARSQSGYFYTTPIHFAVREGHLEIVRMLLDAGGDSEWNGHYGASLIDLAKERNHDDIVKLLEQARALRGRTPPSETREDHPIHIAAQAGDARRVRELLDADPSLVNRGDRAGGTPLHRAAAASLAKSLNCCSTEAPISTPSMSSPGSSGFCAIRRSGHRHCAVGRIREENAASSGAHRRCSSPVLALAPVEK